MSSSIDERIVEMTFKSQNFIKGIQQVVTVLQTLKDRLSGLKGSESAINNLDDAGKKFSLSNLSNGVESVTSKFSALSVLGISALASIAARAVTAGITLVKSFTIDPILDGLSLYETKINAIQTILANTSAEGTNLAQVTSALNTLNLYANKTVYNFGQMAQSIGTFTAAGVDLKTSVSSIKGIANLAALSGSSAEQATSAMYQLSQAIAAGRVKLQDWNSVVNAGLGGKVFQNALIETARVHGVAIDAMLKKDNGFRNSLQSGWLTSQILTDTLDKFTGDLTASQLKSLGYTNSQTQAILKQADAAVKSATQVRTFTQLQQDLSEEVGTAWSTIWGTLIGNINQATKVLSATHTTLENAFTNPIYALNTLLLGFDKLGGRDDLIKAITNSFHDLEAILKPIQEAFRDVFPPATAADLVVFAIDLDLITQKLKIGAKGSEDLRKTFDGLFSVVKIVIDILSGLASAVGVMFGAVGKGSGSFLSLTARLGDFITSIREAIEAGGALNKFFTILGNVLAFPIRVLAKLAGSFGDLSKVTDAAVKSVSPFASKVAAEFSKLGGAIGDALKNGDFSNIANILNQVLYGSVLLAIRKFISGLGKTAESGESSGLLATIKESFEGLTGALEAMQTNLKAGTLEKIAISVALLTASLVALSFISIGNLTKSLTAITVMFTQLMTAMATITQLSGTAGIVKMTAIGTALILLATAIDILAGAVAILAHFSWEELARGLSAVTGLLTVITTALLLLSGNTKGAVAAAYSIEIIAVGMNILASAVGKLGKMDFETLAKGVGTITAVLIVIGAFNKLGGGESLIVTAASMVILGAALNIIAVAIKTLGELSISELAKGVISIAAALILIAAAMALMPKDMILTGAGLVVVASALILISDALTKMGGMSWAEIGKSMVVLAGSLLIIAAAMAAMTEALPGAAALIVVAASLAILTPVLVTLGQMSWEEIGKGLAALAGVLLLIGVAGLVLTPVIPVLLGLGAAITLIGLGVLTAGVGLAALGVGITAIAVSGAAAGAAIVIFTKSVIDVLFLLGTKVGEAVGTMAIALAKTGGALTVAFTVILNAILTAIIKIVPVLVKAFEAILDGIISITGKESPKVAAAIAVLILVLLNTMTKYDPQFAAAGSNFLANLLNGIAKNEGKIIAAATNVVIGFINAIGAGGLRIDAAGANMVISFINGTANTIRADAPRLNAAGVNLAEAIIQGMTIGIFSGIPDVENAALSMASRALSAAKSFLHINSPSKDFIEVGESTGEGAVIGINNGIPDVENAAENMGNSALKVMQKSLSNVSDVINSNMDLAPKITPVIDLTQAKQGLDSLSTMTKSQIISAGVSTATATSISADNAAAANSAGVSGVSSGSKTFNYNQYNTSPKPLDNVTIYRQTKNQLSTVKGALPG